jgi:elongation factor Tu
MAGARLRKPDAASRSYECGKAPVESRTRIARWIALAVLTLFVLSPGAALAQSTKDKFERNKPHVTVGTIGQIDHGKTTLTAAILAYLATKGLAQEVSYEGIHYAPEERTRGIVISTSQVEYQTETRHYSHFDSPKHSDYVKNFVSGAVSPDGVILVVSATHGPMPQTREHLRLAREVGVPAVVVFLSKVDQVDDRELLNFIEAEIRELLTHYGYPGDTASMIRGSALNALKNPTDANATRCIADLLAAMDRDIPMPPRTSDLPFLLPVENASSVAGTTVASGRIARGTLHAGDELEIVGLGAALKTTVVGIEMFRRVLDQATAGDNVGLRLSDVPAEEILPGMVIAHPGTILPRTRFGARVYVLTQQEGGRSAPLQSGYAGQFHLRTVDVDGVLTLPVGAAPAALGSDIEAEIELAAPIAVEPGLRFAIRERGRTIGVGVITRIIE